MDYRNLARRHLDFAEEHLAQNKNPSLKYAALELRMAMEAITYDRAAAYKEEFPPEEYDTWQPRKVMAVLLEIDPMADQDSSIAIGIEEHYGVPAPEMSSLGTEKVLSLKVLKKHYDALGCYLHVQSLKNIRSGKALNYQKIRKRYEDISKFIAEVLSSPVFNCTVGMFSGIECGECGNPIRKRIPMGEETVVAKCYECKATYMVTEEGEDKAKWTPHQHEIECGNKDCQHKFVMWHHEIEIGKHWECPSCEGTNRFALGITFESSVS